MSWKETINNAMITIDITSKDCQYYDINKTLIEMINDRHKQWSSNDDVSRIDMLYFMIFHVLDNKQMYQSHFFAESVNEMVISSSKMEIVLIKKHFVEMMSHTWNPDG